MQRKLFVLLPLIAIALAAPADASAQHAEEQAVKDVVIKVFDGMRALDTVMMKQTFAPGMRMYGVGENGQIQAMDPSGWLRGIGSTPAGTVIDEVLHDVEVRIDGPLAMVWTYYDLFVGENFLHCGYDAFTLMKTQGEWKIVSVADTRRKEGCRQKRS